MELFGYLRALGMQDVVVQWSRYDAIDFRLEVDRVLRAGFHVWMGLGYESNWWRQPSPEMVRGATRDVSRMDGVRGYYLPHELEAGSWAGPQRFGELADAIRAVRSQFHPLAISGFTNRGGGPAAFANFWRELQRRSKFDRLLFQDGIGARKMSLAEWPDWAAPLARALGRRLTIVVETFSAQGEGTAWQAAPAEWTRIQEQMRVAGDISRNDLLAFSAPEYMTPLGGESAAKLFHLILLNLADTHK